MKIVFLSKRQYMSHDVIADQYGRLYQFPYQLSQIGHDVVGVCLSYHCTETRDDFTLKKWNSKLVWQSYNAGPGLTGLPSYIYKVKKIINDWRPDILLGASDSIHAIITQWLAARTGTPYFIDLYDNFESFGLSKIPGVTPLFRNALRNANGIAAVSDALRGYIRTITPETPVITLESTIDPQVFKPKDKIAAREKLGLPAKGLLIGTAGSLSGQRGTGLLYNSFKTLVKETPSLHLVLAGNIDPKTPPPDHANTHYFGRIPHNKIPLFFSALDVVVICMQDTDFGRYAFPQKAYEIISSKVPIVAANVGAIGQLFSQYPACLYKPNNLADLTDKIRDQLKKRITPVMEIPTWRQQAKILANFIASSTKKGK